MESIRFPFEIKDLEDPVADDIKKYFPGLHAGLVRVGPKGYICGTEFKEKSIHIYNLTLRSDDVFVCSFPRSGSTWMRELVWMVSNDFNYAEASETLLAKRFISLEFIAIKENMKNELLRTNSENKNYKELIEVFAKPGYERLASALSPRFIYSHLPMSLLPPPLLDTSKMVYIARDPRDVVVSFYHYSRLHTALGYVGDFKTFWNFFKNDFLPLTPYFENLKEAWMKRHHPNMLFLFYEDVSKDLPSTIRQVAAFLNKQCSDEQVIHLTQHLSIDSFRSNKSLNFEVQKNIGLLVEGEQPYIRKGKSGGWRDYFTGEMKEQVNSWIQDNLRDTDLSFPSMNMTQES